MKRRTNVFIPMVRVHNAPVYALHCKSLQQNPNKRTNKSVRLSRKYNVTIKICMVLIQRKNDPMTACFDLRWFVRMCAIIVHC